MMIPMITKWNDKPYRSLDITIHRLTGDAPKELLLAPLWAKDKRAVLNGLHRYMRENHLWQGKALENKEISSWTNPEIRATPFIS